MPTIDKQRDDKLAKVFSALGDETRMDIMELLIKYPDICVSSLAEELDISVSAVSQQCKLLELSGILTRVRKGQKICYQIKQTDPVVRKVIKMIKE